MCISLGKDLVIISYKPERPLQGRKKKKPLAASFSSHHRHFHAQHPYPQKAKTGRQRPMGERKIYADKSRQKSTPKRRQHS